MLDVRAILWLENYLQVSVFQTDRQFTSLLLMAEAMAFTRYTCMFQGL